MSNGGRPMVKIELEVDREAYERFVHLIHNFNAIKNAGDPEKKASIKSIKIRGR